ncbi:MAG TPA: YciI family protein, partial [Candidatus Sulfotelmatobacter sp.]|nr:YciI family protein [Candidatus Sulfotelmatobacter sp.]
LRANGQYVGGNRLDLTSKATTVRVREGKKLVTDGPFAETKEQLGGYFLVEANDLDEAIRVAGKIPAARWGSIEVRPIVPVPVPAMASV